MSSHRYYAERFPKQDELVMVQVRAIEEMGAYVTLLEYGNIEGMILLSELSRRRIRSIQKLIRVGRNEVVVVMRVDEDKGYIDLSKRRVSAEDIAKCEDRYNRSKTVASITRHVAENVGMEVEKVNEMVTWPLYSKFGHAYDAFKIAIADPAAVFGDMDIPENIRSSLQTNIARRLTPQPVKIRSDIELTCFTYPGILAIKRALMKAAQMSTTEIPLDIRLIAPPLYVLLSNATDKNGAIERMEKAIQVIQESIESEGGKVEVQMKPKAVSESDELELEALMKRVQKENQEVAGDSDDSEGNES